MAEGIETATESLSNIIKDKEENRRFYDDMIRFLNHQNMLENIKQEWIKKGRDEMLKLFEQGLPIEEIKDWLEA